MNRDVLKLANSTIGFGVIEKGKKTYIVQYVKVPKSGKGLKDLPDPVKKGILEVAKGSRYIAPAFGVMIYNTGKEFYSALSDLHNEFTNDSKENRSKTNSKILQDTLKKRYATTSEAWKKLLIKPAFQGVMSAIGIRLLSKVEPTTASIMRPVDIRTKKMLGNLALELQITPVKYKKYENLGTLKAQITNELKDVYPKSEAPKK